MSMVGKEDNTIKAVLFIALGIIGQLIVFILSNFLSAKYSPSPFEAIFISLIVIVIALFCWLVVRCIFRMLNRSANEGRITTLSKNNNSCCTKNQSLVCPLNMGFENYVLVHKYHDATSKENRLFEKDFVYKREQNGAKGKPWNDIWIFSENLSSEIDQKTKAAELVLTNNIFLNRTRYVMFYLNNDSQKDEIESRKTVLLSSLKIKQNKQLLSFCPINTKSGYLGKNTLPLLCGSILFSQNKNNNGEPIFTEGYLSIRKNNEEEPIYYKLPRCMLREYTNYFREIYNNKNNNSQ